MQHPHARAFGIYRRRARPGGPGRRGGARRRVRRLPRACRGAARHCRAGTRPSRSSPFTPSGATPCHGACVACSAAHGHDPRERHCGVPVHRELAREQHHVPRERWRATSAPEAEPGHAPRTSRCRRRLPRRPEAHRHSARSPRRPRSPGAALAPTPPRRRSLRLGCRSRPVADDAAKRLERSSRRHRPRRESARRKTRGKTRIVGTTALAAAESMALAHARDPLRRDRDRAATPPALVRLARTAAARGPHTQYMPERIILVDSNSLIYRGYFAIPPLTTTKGELSNATFGFASILLKAIEEIKPQHIAAAFDLPAKNLQTRARRDVQGDAQADARRAAPAVRALQGASRKDGRAHLRPPGVRGGRRDRRAGETGGSRWARDASSSRATSTRCSS